MTPEPNNESGGLSQDLREEYAGALSERLSGWVYIAAIMLAVAVYYWVIDIDSRGWVKIAGGIIALIVSGVLTQAFISWRKKSILESYEDSLLEEKYIAHEKNVRYDRFAIYGGAMILVAVFALSSDARIFAIGVLANAANPATCVIEHQHAFDDSFLIGNEMNRGHTVTVNVRNAGADGKVKVDVSLDTSEGTFTRYQEISLAANQTRDLRYQFHEPTDDATNVTYAVTCTP